MSSARLILDPRDPKYALASPYSLSERKKHGLEPAAELRISVPHGKSERVLVADLGRSDLLALIAAASSALMLLDQDASADA